MSSNINISLNWGKWKEKRLYSPSCNERYMTANINSARQYINMSARKRSLAARPVAKLLYGQGVPSHLIVAAFRKYDVKLSTKTVLAMAHSTGGVRGYSPQMQKQLYTWTKTKNGPHKKWQIVGKITPKLDRVAAAFVKWFAASRIHGIAFDLSAVMRGEKPP